jgi:4-amino-4-deoxy-L-arabinose transferase-like glycosyltransferase
VKTRLSIFIAAVFVRALVLHHLYAFLASTEYVDEAVTIAKSLLLSHTFGGVYGRPEATAWLAPDYPALVVLVFWLFGVATPMATTVLLSLNGLFSALTSVVTYELGKRLISNTAGLIAGWAWALSAYIASVSFLIWDTSLSTLLLTLAVLLTLANRHATRAPTWIWLGSLWGIAALFSPAVLAPFAVLLLYCACQRRIRPALLAAVACALVLVPWSLRNWHTFHQLFLIRDNMWAEIYFGNISYALHPMGTSGVYQRMGEGPFLTMLKERTLNWIASHPADFAVQSASRALKFWTLPRFADGTLPVCLGLLGMAFALHRRRSSALPLLLILAAYPLVYYMSVVFSRFRYLIDPIVYVLAGYGLQRMVGLVTGLFRTRVSKQPLMQCSSETT